MGALLAEMRSNINLRRLISDGIPDTQSITLAGKLKDELKLKLISLASISQQLAKTPKPLTMTTDMRVMLLRLRILMLPRLQILIPLGTYKMLSKQSE
jgi:hypothetical protein